MGAAAVRSDHRSGLLRRIGAGAADAALVCGGPRCWRSLLALCRVQSGKLRRAARLSASPRAELAVGIAELGLERRLCPPDRAGRGGGLDAARCAGRGRRSDFGQRSRTDRLAPHCAVARAVRRPVGSDAVDDDASHHRYRRDAAFVGDPARPLSAELRLRLQRAQRAGLYARPRGTGRGPVGGRHGDGEPERGQPVDRLRHRADAVRPGDRAAPPPLFRTPQLAPPHPLLPHHERGRRSRRSLHCAGCAAGLRLGVGASHTRSCGCRPAARPAACRLDGAAETYCAAEEGCGRRAADRGGGHRSPHQPLGDRAGRYARSDRHDRGGAVRRSSARPRTRDGVGPRRADAGARRLSDAGDLARRIARPQLFRHLYGPRPP